MDGAGKMCKVNGASCKKTIQARCYHCGKDLCGAHLLEHIQLVQGKTQDELNSLVDQFNEASSRFAGLAIPPRILDEPFSRLEQWREEAHRQIDLTTEMKRQELTAVIRRYKRTFAISKEQHLKKIATSKVKLAAMLAETDASRGQIANVQSVIDQAMNYLASLGQHRISIVPKTSTYPVNIRIETGDDRFVIDKDLREFQITYVRLNGWIHSYHVLTNENGNMADLKNSFVEEYSVLNESSGTMRETNDPLSHRPQANYILPVEIYNHRVHLQYQEGHLLKDVEMRDKIVFYESSYNLIQENNLRFLMPCSFHQHSMRREPVGLPIFLDVPRRNCRGVDVRDAMHDALDRFLSIDSKAGPHLFDMTVIHKVNHSVTLRKLHEVLPDEMDFTKGLTSMTVVISAQMVEAYQNTDGRSTETLYNLLNWN